MTFGLLGAVDAAAPEFVCGLRDDCRAIGFRLREVPIDSVHVALHRLGCRATCAWTLLAVASGGAERDKAVAKFHKRAHESIPGETRLDALAESECAGQEFDRRGHIVVCDFGNDSRRLPKIFGHQGDSSDYLSTLSVTVEAGKGYAVSFSADGCRGGGLSRGRMRGC